MDNKVIDSRVSKDGEAIRRRRECMDCAHRFTTYEQIEDIPIMIVKKDGRREIFNRDKVSAGIRRACEKLDVSMNTIDTIIDNLERSLRETGEKEIPSYVIGEQVMQKLHDLSDIAYVRFASVYRSFQNIDEFLALLQAMRAERN
jgi:transcriptional repressor NrdR